jgi:lipoate-protein ligase A
LCPTAGRGPDPQPLLCFQRRAAGDVLVGQTKIAGSAQRRRRGAVLQHGSVLLRRSPAAPELASLEDASGKTVDIGQLSRLWLAKLAARLVVTWLAGTRSPQEERLAAALVESRYASARWTEHRGR